jgi:AAA domain
MTEARPLHLHTVDSVCTDLVCGRDIGVGTDGETYSLDNVASRSILNWYRQNRSKWSGNVLATDVEIVVDAAALKPPELGKTDVVHQAEKKQLTLTKIEAHRFGGLNAYSDAGQPPENFVLAPTKSITLLEGWNGSGKTSVLNAVIWCLTGQLLRPQRKPEQADAEFECRIEPTADSDATHHKLTPVTPLPDRRFLPDLSHDTLPIDTWVELTFVDEAGKTLPPVRRAQSRTSRRGVSEVVTGLTELGVDPVAAQIGTTIPGLLPFIQIGSVSELGQAVAQLTGLSALVDLARHATKVEERLDGEFRKARTQEIQGRNDAFRQARDDLQELIDENPSLSPTANLPEPSTSMKLEEDVKALEEHFSNRKTRVLADAKLVLGESFDPSNKKARDDLESSVAPALAQLGEISKLPSIARLGGLNKLTEGERTEATASLNKIMEEANTLAELTKNPSIGRRKQLYARVSAWMKEHNYPVSAGCAVCGGDLECAVDTETHRPIRDELQEAADGNAELVSHTITSWEQSRLGQLSKTLPEALSNELRRDLPAAPSSLLKSGLVAELFDTSPFKGTLAVLREATRNLADGVLGELLVFRRPAGRSLPPALNGAARDLELAIQRADIALCFSNWQQTNRDAVNAAVAKIVTKKNPNSEPLHEESSLGVKVVALSEVIKNAAPVNTALEYCERMKSALKVRRQKEDRIGAYDIAIAGLKQIISLGELAQRQVDYLRVALQGRSTFWRARFYNNAYHTSGLAFVGTEMDSKGTLSIHVGSDGVSAPAQHVSNASALRASLVGFFLAFWEHVFLVRGGFTLLILDDPQELLDDDNRDRLARTLPELTKVGARLLVTTHSRNFARMAVEEGRKDQLVEHRSVHPVNWARATAETAPAIEELDRKWIEFVKHVDDAAKAQDYANEARAFIEARLADLFDDPAYPAYSASSKAPGFSNLLGRLRGLVGKPPNELFRKRALQDFCNDRALAEGSKCLELLNKAHHKDKSRISYKDVKDEEESLRRLRRLIEEVHEEFRRWKWRDAAPAAGTVVSLRPVARPTFKVHVNPDLAAFTGAPAKGETQDVGAEELDGSWFKGKSLFYLRSDNLGFAAPASSIAIVESDSKPGNDRNLVIAFHRGNVLARRLLRPQGDAIAIALAAQTPDPRKSPPTVLVDAAEIRIHRILGVLFDDVPPPISKHEAAAIEDAPSLGKIETAYRVRDDSALPLALPGQIILGGPCIRSNELDAKVGRFVAITLTDGSSIFKRVGTKLPGAMAVLRQFEAIGGLGASEIIATEEPEGEETESQFCDIPTMAFARLVLGVIYE